MTGVQTCALPICTHSHPLISKHGPALFQRHESLTDRCQCRLAMLLEPCCLPLPLALLLAGSQVTGQPGQPAPPVGPDPAQLEKDGRIGRTLRISQESFELLEALLTPEYGALLLPELVTQTLTFPLELGEFTLQLGPVPEQAQELVVFDRLATGTKLLGEG